MSCCPPTRCAVAPPGEYQAQGAFASIKNEATGKDLRYYAVDGKKNVKAAVVVIADVLGVDTGRHLGVCDSLAEALGCKVVCPDLFHGQPATGDMFGTPRFGEMVKEFPPSAVAKDLDVVYKNLVGEAEVLGLIGFCWGSWINYHEAVRGADDRIKCAANFHPSLKLEGFFGGKADDLIAQNTLPMLVCPCKDDMAELKPGGLLPDSATISVFQDMNHGFMTQGDITDKAVHRDVIRGIQLATSYFQAKLGLVSCCPASRCALTPAPEYEAKGVFHNVSNPHNGKELRYYQVDGEKIGKHAIILIHDVFGIDCGRHLGVCDALAQALNCRVVCPDLFRGDVSTFEMLDTPEFMELVKRHPPESVAKDLDYMYQELLTPEQFDSIGLVGFCWGCLILHAEAGRSPDPRVKAGANFHPALGLAGCFSLSEKDLVADHKLKMLYCPCSDDPDNVKPGGMLPESATIHVFEDQQHGFMTQGDVSDEKLRNDIDLGIDLAKAHFAAHL